MKTLITIMMLLLTFLGNSAKAIELQAENNSIGHWEFLVKEAKVRGFNKAKAENIVGNSAHLDPRIAGKGWGGKVWKGDTVTYSIGFVKMKSGRRQVFRIDSIVRNGKLLKPSTKIQEQIDRIAVEPVTSETVAVAEPVQPTEPTTPATEVAPVAPAPAPVVETRSATSPEVPTATTTEVFDLNRPFLTENAPTVDLPMPGDKPVLNNEPPKATPAPVTETPKAPEAEESVTVKGVTLTVSKLQEIGDQLLKQREKVPGVGSDLLPGLNIAQQALLSNLNDEDGQRLKEFIQNKGVQAKLGMEKTKLFGELGAEMGAKKGRLATDDLGNKEATKPQPTPVPQAPVATSTPAPTSPKPDATPTPVPVPTITTQEPSGEKP